MYIFLCGIAGFCKIGSNYLKDKKKWKNILKNMNIAQKHRGPDDSAIFISKFCGLAHVRLCIIDIEKGKQPMSVSLNGKKYVLVYNGEIYNMKELRLELQNKGAIFKTNSDTEVILLGHVIFGENFVKRLNGIFSYALWDEGKQKLFLYRDRVGVKPLFYTFKNDCLIFASEIKAIFEYPKIRARVDKNGLCEIFALGPARSFGSAVFKDIYEVLPGYYLSLSRKGLEQVRYWQLSSRYHKDSLDETIYKTSYLLKDAIKKQMMSDLPICTFLSGGVDSSLVSSICSKELFKKGEKLNTFSFDYVGNKKYFNASMLQPSQDRPWVDKMVKYLGTNHTYLECDSKDLVDNLFRAVDAKDLPAMADIDSSLIYFCSKVAEKNRVALTGECADEIFGGYPWFYREAMFKANIFPWSLNMASRKVLLSNCTIDALPIDEYAQNAYEKTLKMTPKLYGESKDDARRREIFYLNLKWFMATLLDRMDRTSMYSGIEARVPFSDHRIIEYLWNVPWDIKYSGNLAKGLLRAAGRKFLPEEVLYRKKSPYPKTYDPYYEKLLKDIMLEVIASSNSPICNFISKKKVLKFLNTPSDYKTAWYGQLMAGPQMIAYMLQINYWFLKYNVDIAL